MSNSYLNRIAIGTAQFTNYYGISNEHGITEQDDVNDILKFAEANGIKFIDTAIGYGLSEKSIGISGVRGFQYISKLPSLPKDILSSDIQVWVQKNIIQSIKNLGADKLFAFLLHNSNDLKGPNADYIFDTLREAKENKLIKFYGYSLYDPHELDQLFERFKPDIVQIPYNVFDHRFSDAGWISRLNNEGVIVHARSIFLQGLLLMPEKKIPKYFLRWHDHFRKWNIYLNKNNFKPLQACISYVLKNEKIDQLIIGIENIKQIEEIVFILKNNIINVGDNFGINDSSLINPSKWKIL